MINRIGARPLWAPWFDSLNSPEAIRDKATVRVNRLPRSQLENPVAAQKLLWSEWKRIYLPDDQLLSVLSQYVDRARHFAGVRYPLALDSAAADDVELHPDDGDHLLWLLSGLAGTGKSSTMAALARLLSPPSPSGVVLPGVLVQHRPVLHIKLESTVTISALFRSLANPVFAAGRTNIKPEELRTHIKLWLHAQSVLLIVLDELQFLSRSENASVRIANLVSEMLELGIPVAYVCNYSLGHKLKRRNQEDTDRLLQHPTIVTLPSDDHWQSVVSEYLKVCPELFTIDPAMHAAEIGRLTAKLYRPLRTLLTETCRLAWASGDIRPVTMDDVRVAAGSRGFGSHRETVEDLKSLPFSETTRKRRKDLICPFEDTTSPRHSGVAVPPAGGQRPQPSPAAVHQFEGAINAEGRRLLRDLNRPAANSGEAKQKSASVTRPRKKGPVTAEDLLAGAKRLSDELSRRPAQHPATDPDRD